MAFESVFVGLVAGLIMAAGFTVLGYAIGAKGTDEIIKECENVDRNKIIDKLIEYLEGLKEEANDSTETD